MKPYSGGVRHDYKDTLSTMPASRQRRWSWFVLGLALPIAGVVLLLVSEPNQSKTPAPREVTTAATFEPASQAVPSESPIRLAALTTGAVAAPVQPITAELEIEANATRPREPAPELDAALLDLLVERGDTLEILFRRNDLSLSDLAAMVALPEAAQYLKLLKPGDEIRVAHREGRIVSLDRELGDIDLLTITRADDGFEAQTVAREVDIRTVGAHGVIRTSLFEAAMEAGLSDAITMDMANNLFQWDIDFIQDVRVGDEFTVIHEELWRDGRKLRDGRIVAAEFINRGKSHRAARFESEDGDWDYYTPEGRSVRKAFIRAPVDFTRISSNFNPNRRHPVLNTIRAHRGVDYAAPNGTPVKAAGDGKVQVRGTQGGYGNVVILQHGGNITTLYGHLSRFGKPRLGSRVRQGDIIGYVGSSGLATGPHLHYEYRIAGVHRNPRTVELPAAEPVPAEHRAGFERATARLWRQLDLYQTTQLANATP